MLKNKNILVCVTGGIAAYKAVNLVSALLKRGANVKVQMTENSKRFITPFTFYSLTGNKTMSNMFDEDAYIEHIESVDWADFIVIAPATANIIGKAANGIADDLISATIIAATKPILFLPAMNMNMYANPIVQANMNKLQSFGFYFLEPESGLMACGTVGKGRYPKKEEIIFAIETYLKYDRDLNGKRILITAGASVEKLDPMRILTNCSTGKMGLALVRAAYLRGAEVTFIHSDLRTKIPYYIKGIQAKSAKEMYEKVTKEAARQDIIIMNAAVADYTFKNKSEHKIKKSGELSLKLIRTEDILKKLGDEKKDRQLLIGFAAESKNIIENAKNKIIKKNLDYIVANSLKVAGKNKTEAVIISKSNEEKKISGTKFEAAHKILDTICE